jgi:DNA modification methylase
VDTNIIYCGDNLEVLAKFPDNSIDLIYADPPFFSNKQYEIIWGNGAEQKVYEDRWKGGINVYIEWMKERIWQCYRVLNDTGTMYLHCDWHASHRLRVAMDDIFGENNFRNEIIWCYAGGGIPKNDFPRKHDTIYRYTKTKKYLFNPEYRPYTEGTMQRGRTKVKGIYAIKGLRAQGTPINDWWTDINPIHSPTDPEKLGYPTQKPEALLKRIIETSSNKGCIVLDPFSGGGTTPVVAHQLGRKWIAIDVSPIACTKMKDRLNKIGVNDVHIIGAPKTIKELKKLEPFQFQNWAIDRIGGHPSTKKSSDMGIDGFTFMTREPVQIKQSEGVGRNVVDNFETAVRRQHKKTGYIIAFSFAKGAYEEAARAKLEKDSLDIKLVRVDELDKYFPHSS